MIKSETLKKALFWTAVTILPGGMLLLAYQVGKNKGKMREFVKKQIERIRR